MYSLFLFLFLLALVTLIVGLIKPRRFKKIFKDKTNREVVGMSLGALTFVFFILAAVTSPPQHNSSNSTALTNAKTSAPVITTKTITTTASIAYTTSTEQDSSLASGTTLVKTKGVNGVKTQTWKVTYSNGVEKGRTLISTVITTPAVNEVIEQGTYVAPKPVSSAPTTTTPSAPSCTPLTNGGNCYEPGEYCRDSDHGASGVAGDGEHITCEDNNGWRWEPN